MIQARNRHVAHPVNTLDVNSLARQVESLQLSKRAVAKEQKDLESLTFPARPVRHSTIHEAHSKTFQWVFEGKSNNKTPTAFARWLEAGTGIFWVSGKPGSGKSTFSETDRSANLSTESTDCLSVKFVSNHPTTHKLVSQSSPDVICVSHYFWNSGTELQKSQEGLLRSLLFELFRQNPDLMHIVCHARMSNDKNASMPWSLPELQQTLRALADGATRGPSICFFIDGMDEYSGDYEEICQALHTLARSHRVKLCLSSRPWNVFKDAFGGGPSTLCMEDLTRDDIKAYTRSRLEEHDRWKTVISSEPDPNRLSSWLIDGITDKACGVFLWVFLVTRQLRNGLTNRDSFSDMCRRLESFPPELKDFFLKIFNSVEPFYHRKMATMLRLAVTADEPLGFEIYAFHEEEHDNEDYFLRVPAKRFTEAQLEKLNEDTAYRLNSRTQGLLEITFGRVHFLHRTVKDFLDTGEMPGYLAGIAGSRLPPYLSLL